MKASAKAVKRHAHMVDDPLRTRPLLRAIKKTVRPGDVVLDIGTGLGILAIAAAEAGAQHVWAIDCDESALAIARQRAAGAGASDRISFVHGLSFGLELPVKADLIICETVGSFAFDENILATIKDAKLRLLKRSGKVIPNELELWGAPCSVLPKFKGPAEIAAVEKRNLLSEPALLASASFSKGKIPNHIHIKQKFRFEKNGNIKSVAVWPCVKWCEGEITDASPFSTKTHWKQGILPVEIKTARKGASATLELIVAPHPDDPHRMTERLWRWTK